MEVGSPYICELCGGRFDAPTTLEMHQKLTCPKLRANTGFTPALQPSGELARPSQLEKLETRVARMEEELCLIWKGLEAFKDQLRLFQRELTALPKTEPDLDAL